MIKVSVIIPVYNVEKYLEECLDSCLKQTLKEIEIICINDGSTDKTVQILEIYAKHHRNICVINQENLGAGSARNKGIEIAEGEFIAFMDADDRYPNNGVLELLYSKAIEQNVKICGGSLCNINSNTNFLELSKEKGRFFEQDVKMRYSEYQFAYFFTRFIYKKDLLLQNGVKFPMYRHFEDPPFLVQAMIAAKEFYALKEKVYAYRNTDKIVCYTSSETISGIANGILDILRLSKLEKLEVLHADMIEYFKNSILLYAYNSIYNGNREINSLLRKIVDETDEELLQLDFRKLDKPYIKSLEEINQLMKFIKQKEEQLLSLVNGYKKVYIYGAGHAGRILDLFLQQKNYKGVLEFIVTNKKSVGTANGKSIKSINDCNDLDKSNLVLVASKYYADEMVSYARKKGFKNIRSVCYEELHLFVNMQ